MELLYVVLDMLPNFSSERFDLFCYQQEHMRPPAARYICQYWELYFLTICLFGRENGIFKKITDDMSFLSHSYLVIFILLYPLFYFYFL